MRGDLQIAEASPRSSQMCRRRVGSARRVGNLGQVTQGARLLEGRRDGSKDFQGPVQVALCFHEGTLGEGDTAEGSPGQSPTQSESKLLTQS
jgi:hypothetical protein